MAEKVVIDEKYTYVFDDGKVEIMRNGEPWLGAENGSFEGSKAWIAAASAIEDLRREISELKEKVFLLEEENFGLQDQIHELEN